MKIKNLSEEEQAEISSPSNQIVPSKTDFLKQLEADYLVAQRDGNEALMQELDERHDRVSATNTDQDALAAYEYREGPITAT